MRPVSIVETSSVGTGRTTPPIVISWLRRSSHTGDLLAADNLDRRGREAEHDAPVALASWSSGGRAERRQLLADHDVIDELGQVGALDVDVDVVTAEQPDELRQRERRLGRTAPAEQHDLAHGALPQGLQSVVGDVGGREAGGVRRQDAGDVEGDIAVAHDDGPLAAQVERVVRMLRVAVVPSHEVGRRGAARQLLPRDAERTVLRGAGRVDDRVVVLEQVVVRELRADVHVEEVAETGLVLDLPEQPVDRLRGLVIGRDPGTYEAVRRGQPVDHVDLDARPLQQLVGRIQRCRPRPDDRDPQDSPGGILAPRPA